MKLFHIKHPKGSAYVSANFWKDAINKWRSWISGKVPDIGHNPDPQSIEIVTNSEAVLVC